MDLQAAFPDTKTTQRSALLYRSDTRYIHNPDIDDTQNCIEMVVTKIFGVKCGFTLRDVLKDTSDT